MKLEILSFNGKLFKSETVSSVTAMTKAGEITVLSNHSALITSLKPSVLRVVYLDENNMKQEKDFAIGGGILEVANNSMKILIDMLISVDEVDLNLAEQAKQKALEMMEKYKHSADRVDMEKFIEAEDMLLKSIAQLKLGEIK
ncbi:MAG: ATP synthase F1 subunit epsilon [Candidatus Gracilibacteria bacterium]|nr:ATP synthase F1 subunit epsilon [Candidatus Gracilibacteria bacterium]